MHCLYSVCTAQRVALILALLFSSLNGRVRADGCHTPSKDIGDEEHLSADICSLVAALDRSPADYITAEAYYRLGYESRNVTLMEIGTGESISGGYVNRSMELFEGEAWMDNMLQEAFEGTGMFEDLEDLRRATFIEKFLQSSVLVHRLFSNLDAAYAQAESGRRNRAIEFIERSMANFFGSESDCSVFGVGQSRGIEFGATRQGAALTNYDIVEAFADGVLSIEEDPIDLESLQESIDLISKNVVTIYLQAVIKYATRIANDNASLKSQAEGFGYYLAIAGRVEELVPEAHAVILDAFSFENDPDADKAEEVKGAVDDVLTELGVNEDDFGTFDEEASGNYETPEEVACEALNPFVDSFVESGDSDR